MATEESPTVSIILCIYNSGMYMDYVEEYLRTQTFDDVEVIFVVDSRSTDDSLDRVSGICSRMDNAMYVIQEEPTKLGGAKNLGLQASSGKYIWFLDSDDLPSPDFLSVMVGETERTGSDMAVCNFQYTDGRDWQGRTDGATMVMTGKQALTARALNLMPVTSWAMLYNREQIMRAGIRFREMMCEDIVFTYIVLNYTERVCFVTSVLYGYYLSENSFCRSTNDVRGVSELESYAWLSDRFPKDDKFLQKRFAVITMRSMIHMTSEGTKTNLRDPRLERMVTSYASSMERTEYRLARIFPTIYNRGGNWYMRNYYCRPGKVYSGKDKIEKIRKIINSD